MAHILILNATLTAVGMYRNRSDFFCSSYCDFRTGKVNLNIFCSHTCTVYIYIVHVHVHVHVCTMQVVRDMMK